MKKTMKPIFFLKKTTSGNEIEKENKSRKKMGTCVSL
jgi:hypothetical protein